jgi:hypothetical protein
MRLELAIAGLACFLLAVGHTTVGVRSVLPRLAEANLPARARAMVRFTWYVVTLNQLGFGILFVTLAAAPGADAKTLLLRWFGAMWIAATALVAWNARHRPRSLLRPPVAFVFVLLAAMCWTASA